MKKHLGYWQVKTLSKITSKGVACYSIMNLRGNAKNYRSKYVQSIHNAVEAHNQKVATNSPINADLHILIGPFGKKGGYGFKTVPRVLL